MKRNVQHGTDSTPKGIASDSPRAIAGPALALALLASFLTPMGCAGPEPPGALPVSLVAGTYGGGVYETTNGGLSWAELEGDPAPPPAYVKRLSWGPGGSLFVSTSGAGIYRQTEHGFRSVEGRCPEVISAIAATGMEDGTIWAGTPERGVFVSRDGGVTWRPHNDGLQFRHVTGFAVAGDRFTLYCATDGGLFRIRDEGAASEWNWITSSVGSWDARAVGCSHRIPTRIVAGGAGVGGPPPLITGMEGRAGWESGGRGLPHGNVLDLAVLDRQGATILYAATSRGVYRSTDGGKRWGRFGRKGPKRNVFTLAASGGYLFAGGEEGLFRVPEEGGRWTQVNRGLPRTAVTSIIPRV